MTGGRDCPPLGRGRLRLAAGNPSEPVELWCQRKPSSWARLSCSHPVPLWGGRETHTHTCKRKQILTGLLFHFSVTGQHDQHIVFMEPWRQGGHVASRHRLPCRRGLQSSLPCASGELWTFFPSSLLFLANSFSHKYPIIKKVHYINVDYLSSNGDTAGVDLLFTDKVALKCQIKILFAFVKLKIDNLILPQVSLKSTNIWAKTEEKQFTGAKSVSWHALSACDDKCSTVGKELPRRRL